MKVMTASGKRLEENKSHIDDNADVMPREIWNLPPGVVQIVAGYAWKYPIEKPTLFSGIPTTDLTKILFLVEHAGSRDEFKFYATRLIQREIAANYAKEKKEDKKNELIDTIFTIAGRQGPLMGILLTGLDQTDTKEDGSVIDVGMAEDFTEIVAELLPHRHQEVLAQARKAAPLETKEAKEAREAINLTVIEQHFNAIKLNDEETTRQAIATLKEFVAGTKERSMDKGHVVDNRYYVNLIHLNAVAIEVLARRGEELPKIDAKDDGRWYGKIADRFCFEIIGATLQPSNDLPARVKQKLKSLYDLFYRGLKAERTVDPNSELFRGVGTDYLHGENSFYNGFGTRDAVPGEEHLFSNLLQAITSASKLYATANPTEVREPMSDNVDLRSNAPAKVARR